MKRTSFYLHSTNNRRLYSPLKYPLTHLLNSQCLQERLSKQSSYVQHFKYTFLVLVLFILISTIFFQVHIYVYNSFFGPFHRNLDEFIEHTREFENGQSWFKRIEYIEIELEEDNILNPSSTYETIRKYANSYAPQLHISTYKKVKKPNIYVKLPTRSVSSFHVRHPFQFSSYSTKTLRCIIKYLQPISESTHNIWIEKSDYVQYINQEYGKNATLFNMLVMTKCGILIGYLYRPMYDKAFLPSREHKFSSNDIAFDATRQYCSFYPLLLCTFIFVWLFLKALFYCFIYLSNLIRYKWFYPIGLFTFPLCLSSDVIDELWILNFDGLLHEQLLQLDLFIQKSKYKFNDQLFIIQNTFEQLCLVLLRTKLDDEPTVDNDLSPFVICPVSEIRKIVQNTGICYGKHLSWIPWPTITTNEENYAEWLHETLMNISEDYQNQYEYRLRNEVGNWIPPSSSYRNSRSSSRHSNRSELRHRRRVEQIETPQETEFKQFIREEENFQRLGDERRGIYENFFEQSSPASPKFIANFRIKQNQNQNLIDSAMEEQKLDCMICLSELEMNDSYEIWPCPSTKPHIFHSHCMLNMLRRQNTCPICRHPVEANQSSGNVFRQIMMRFIA